MSKKVFVGMSGGVDSSLTAALLVEQGYDVTGVYMKNWAKDLPGFECPWREDLADAKRVAVQLGIDFKVYDFQNEYKQHVVDYLIDGYKQGLTPNPDIICNQEVKFRLFLNAALANGADMIATGHYARIQDGKLLSAKDKNKDQTYFLYRMPKDSLDKVIFPLGTLHKEEVRAKAAERGLVTADKKESMGICFVGKIGIKEFLQNYVKTEPGPIIDQNGMEVGEHDGAIFYTIGQRHGLNVGGGLPYYVAGKDMDSNTVYVTTDLDDERLWSEHIRLDALHWLNAPPNAGEQYRVRTRHRGELVDAAVQDVNKTCVLKLNKPLRAVTPGQSTVLYQGERVVGGGIVSGS